MTTYAAVISTVPSQYYITKTVNKSFFLNPLASGTSYIYSTTNINFNLANAFVNSTVRPVVGQLFPRGITYNY